jgi:AraC-like DNA-binding protein
MGEENLLEQIRVLERMVTELWEALVLDTTSAYRARTIRNIEIVRRFIDDGWTPADLAGHFHLSQGQIVRILRNYQIPPEMQNTGLTRRDERIALSYAEGCTLDQIAELHRLSPRSVTRILRRLGIVTAENVSSRQANEKVERNQTFVRLVAEEGWTYQRIADEFGISRQRVCQIIKRESEDARQQSIRVDLPILQADHFDYLPNQLTHMKLPRHHQGDEHVSRTDVSEGGGFTPVAETLP